MQGDALQSIWNIDQQLADGNKLVEVLEKTKAAIISTNNVMQRYKASSGDKSATDAIIQANLKMVDSQNKLTDAIVKSTAAKKQTEDNSKKVEAAARAEAKITDDLANSYKQFSLAVRDAELRAKNLQIELGKNHPLAVEATNDAVQMKLKLIDLDASTGTFTRRVGDYNNALGTTAKSIKGLGGLGIILSRTLGIDPEIADSVREVGRAIRDVQHIREGEELATKGHTVTTSANTTVTNANTIATETNAAALGAETVAIETTTVAQKALNVAMISFGIGAAVAVIGLVIYKWLEYRDATEKVKLSTEELTKAFKDQQEGLDILTESIDFQTKLRLEALKQRGASEKQLYEEERKGKQDALHDVVEQEMKWYKTREDIQARYNKNKEYLDKHSVGSIKHSMVVDEQKELEKQLTEADTNIERIQKDHTKRFREILLDESKFKTTQVKKDGEKVMESVKDVTDLEYEMYKISQARKIKLLDEQFKDQSNSTGERLNVSMDYSKATIELAKVTAAHEIKIDEDKLKVLESNLKKAKGTERNNLIVEIENTKKAIVLVSAKLNDQLIDIEKADQDRITQVDKDEQEKRLKAWKAAEDAIKNTRTNQQAAISADGALRVAALDVQYKKDIDAVGNNTKQKEKIQKAYAIAKAKIDNEELILSLQSQKTEAEGLMALAKLRGEDIIKYTNVIMELTGKITSAQNKTFDSEKQVNDERNKNIDDYTKLAQSTAQVITGLTDAKFNREIDQINKLIDANNKKKEAEVASINESTLSAQEKAAQLIILDKTVAANNERLAREANALKRKQAIADRDAAILSVVANAAVAELKLVGQSGYAGIIAGAIIAAEAAASIALILSKPLPSYAKGTDYHPGGPARFAESGPEEVSIPGKQPFVANRETIGWLPKGTKVRPLSNNIDAAMYNSMMIGTAERMIDNTQELRDIKDAVVMTGQVTAQALRKQKANVVVNVHGYWGAYIEKSVRN